MLDDATSSVDVQVEAEIHEALKSLMEDRTTIVIAHRLSTILLANRVVLVDEGKIVASGTHSDLMAGEPRYMEVLARTEEETGMDSDENRLKASELIPVLDSMEMGSSGDLLPSDTDNFDDDDNYGGSS